MAKFFFLMTCACLLFSIGRLPTSFASENELKTQWGAEAYVRSYKRDNSDGSSASGFAQFLRLKLDLEPGEGLAVRTRTVFSGDRWKGDNADITGNSDNGGGGNDLRLDYGFLEYVEDGWMFRAGRQEASWADCLTVCDDRRDRLLAMKNLGPTLLFFVYDKRSEGSEFSRSDDGDMYSLVALNFQEQTESGILVAWWHNSKGNYVLKDVVSVSPYIKYQAENWKTTLLYHWIGQGDEESWYPDHHHSAALKFEYDVDDKWSWQAQSLQVYNGGYVATGYDTYLSMVNNDLDHNSSNIRQVYLGGFGTFSGGKKKRDSLYSFRLQHQATSRLELGVALGKISYYDSVAEQKFDQDVVDLTLSFKINSYSHIRASVGRLFQERYQNSAMTQFEASF